MAFKESVQGREALLPTAPHAPDPASDPGCFFPALWLVPRGRVHSPVVPETDTLEDLDGHVVIIEFDTGDSH